MTLLAESAEWLGLHYAIWIVVAAYFVTMLWMGWRAKQGIHDSEGYLLGSRRFGVGMMAMHAFGAGTHPGDVAGVTAGTVARGASGIWVSWIYMFGTPFYWLIAPIVRRMRCLTLADYYRERFGPAATVLYVLFGTVGLTVAVGSVLLATSRTVQGMMNKAYTEPKAVVVDEADTRPAPATASAPAPPPGGSMVPAPPPSVPPAGGLLEASTVSRAESEVWFFGILVVSTVVFVVYSFWGGIVAAIRTDMLQGLLMIALSFLAIPAAMQLIGGLDGMRETVGPYPGPAGGGAKGAYLALFHEASFSWPVVLLLCLAAPLSMMGQPHLITVCGAGKTEWEGRVGFTYGNILKRLCTMGWCLLALCWLAFLIQQHQVVEKDAAFGHAVRYLLSPWLQGLMLACVLAAAMSSGDAFQVNIAGLIVQNIYRPYFRPRAEEKHLVHVTRITGVMVIVAAMAVAVAMRESVVKSILAYVNLLSVVGIASTMGILWRRMNSAGAMACILAGGVMMILTRALSWDAEPTGMAGMLTSMGLVARKGEVWQFTRICVIGLPMAVGLVCGVLGSLVTPRPKQDVIDKFFTKIHTPIGQEDRLELPLDQAVPAERRLLTAGGLFLVKPSRQSWGGFLIALAICVACVGGMLWIVG